MIERFNFYDVYGYFIPGALLLALMWLPHALVHQMLPSADFSAAVIAIIGAYVIGHIVQIVAPKVLPSSVQTSAGTFLPPSDILLDNGADSRFSPDFIAKLRSKILTRFGLDVRNSKNRNIAFFLCRNSVIASKTASYVEQFEGMYVLMRGICVAAAAGCAYDLGWLWSPFVGRSEALFPALLFVATSTVATQYRLKLDAKGRARRIAFAAVLLSGIFCAGVIAGERLPRTGHALSAAATLSLFGSLWTWGAYRAFTWTWAQNVYQQFYLLPEAAAGKE